MASEVLSLCLAKQEGTNISFVPGHTGGHEYQLWPGQTGGHEYSPCAWAHGRHEYSLWPGHTGGHGFSRAAKPSLKSRL